MRHGNECTRSIYTSARAILSFATAARICSSISVVVLDHFQAGIRFSNSSSISAMARLQRRLSQVSVEESCHERATHPLVSGKRYHMIKVNGKAVAPKTKPARMLSLTNRGGMAKLQTGKPETMSFARKNQSQCRLTK